MTNENTPNGSPSHSFGVPIAIVLAGGLIALAIYMGGKVPSSAVKGIVGSPIPIKGLPGQSDAPVVVSPTPADISFRPVNDSDHVRGAINPKVTIIEYSDLECPFCKMFHPTLQQVLKEYPNDVQWVYRHDPQVGLHSQAPQESVASECAGEQGKFWEFIDEVYATTPGNNGLDLKTLPAIAKKVGVADVGKFTACLKSTTYVQVVDNDIADAQQAGATGTPYSVIVGPKGQKTPLTGAVSYSQLKGTIDQMLK